MQTNIDYEISQLRDAVFGEDVRSAFISCMEKLHTVSETNANIVIEAERTMNEIRDNAVNALNNLTSKLETGEFIGPPGPQGLPGEKGDTGKTGNTGERGSKWMRGTAITGIDSNGVEFPNSDIENALAGDFFINTSTNDIYECVKSGNPSTAKWAYIGNIKGNKGDRGDVGPQGTVENIDDQILTFELAENLENVKSGETVKIAFGKLMKAVGAFIVHHTQKATTSILGHIKITNSAAVTDSTGLALAATEKNAAISGTLAHQIAQISAQNNDFANNISQLNSNMEHKLSNHGYYNAETSINDMTNPGIYRFYVNPNTDNANYLGWTARTLLICTGDCAGYMYQYFFSDWGHFVYRRNNIQGIITFDYNVLLRRFDAKNEIAELNNRIAALENLIKSNA